MKNFMKSAHGLFQITLLIFCLSPAEAGVRSCLEQVRPIEIQRDSVADGGGLWGYFERHPKLREHSRDAIQLDRRINQVIEILIYLCRTQNGIPLDPLALYVSSNIAAKGAEKFKTELLDLGKTKEKIEIWLKFARYAERQQFRTLEVERIHETIDHSKSVIVRYVKLAEEISNQPTSSAHLEGARSLMRDLDLFLAEEPYPAQALEENSHVPYWDINESSGGS